MRRLAAIVILLLLTSCRFVDAPKRAAANAVVRMVLSVQARAPLTQSAARPATPAPADPPRRLITPCSQPLPRFAMSITVTAKKV